MGMPMPRLDGPRQQGVIRVVIVVGIPEETELPSQEMRQRANPVLRRIVRRAVVRELPRPFIQQRRASRDIRARQQGPREQPGEGLHVAMLGKGVAGLGHLPARLAGIDPPHDVPHMLRDPLVIDGKQVLQARDGRAALLRELIFDQVHRPWIVVPRAVSRWLLFAQT